MAAALLAPGVTTLRNVDPVADLDVMIDVLRAIGADVEWTGAHRAADRRVGAAARRRRPTSSSTRMRASINVLGPLLARCGQARVAMPGGDNIGNRKLDMHFRGLEAMGVELDVVHGFIEARTNRLVRARASCSSSRASAPPRTSSPPRCWPRARPSSRTRLASPRSPTSPPCSTAWVPRSTARARRRSLVEGVEELEPVDERDHGRPHRDRHPAHGRAASPAARRRCSGRGSTTSRPSR